MRKICIISTPLYGYSTQLEDAFIRAGHECKAFTYKIPNRYLNNIPVVRVIYYKLFRLVENNRLSALLLKCGKIDALIFFGMCEFSGGSIHKLKKLTGSTVVFWFIDSIRSYRRFFNAIPCCDYALTYKLSDSDYLNKINIKNSFLPLFFAPELYFPRKNSCKKTDIFFIGALKSRIRDLDLLAKDLDELNLKMTFCGKLSPVFIRKTRHLYPWFYKHHMNHSLSHSEINDFYNSSKICINLQPAQASDALNIRTFEVYASGALLFTDGNYELLKENFRIGEDLIHFDSLSRLIEIIRDYFGRSELYIYSHINNDTDILHRNRHSIDRRICTVLSSVFPEDD